MDRLSSRLTEQVVGKACENFRFVEGGTLILYFRLGPGGPNSLRATLWVDCAWRLRDAERVLVGALDSPECILEHLRKLIGASVSTVAVDDTTADLRLSFSNELVVEGFCSSTEFEVWEFRRSDGYRIGVDSNLTPFESEGGDESPESSEDIR